MNVGDKVPDFSLPDQNGQAVKLADLRGKGPIVFFFYPKDETVGCTREACSFRDAHAELAAAGAIVFGVSGDSVESHAGFAKHHSLNYGLLADVGNKVRDGVFAVPRGLLGLAPGRVTYILDSGGVVRFVHENNLNMGSHVERAIEVVKKLANG
jgi:thioredoxin-dependent peroxiredoxin